MLRNRAVNVSPLVFLRVPTTSGKNAHRRRPDHNNNGGKRHLRFACQARRRRRSAVATRLQLSESLMFLFVFVAVPVVSCTEYTTDNVMGTKKSAACSKCSSRQSSKRAALARIHSSQQMGDDSWTTVNDTSSTTSPDFAKYYASKTATYYAQGYATTETDLPCGNTCPGIRARIRDATTVTNSYAAGGGWLFKTDCFREILGTESAATSPNCVCGWPHTSAGICTYTKAGTPSTENAYNGAYNGATNHALSDAFRSCDIDYGYCGAASTDTSADSGCSPFATSYLSNSPTACSDSSSFVANDHSNTGFGSVQFTNAANGAEFAVAVVMVVPNYRSENTSVVQQNEIAIPINSTTYSTLYSRDRDKVYAGSGMSTGGVTNWEQDRQTSCVVGQTVSAAQLADSFPYTYGPDGSTPTLSSLSASALSAHDTVYFANCILPQQIQPCCTGKTKCCNVTGTTPTNAGGDCCGTAGCSGDCNNMTVNPSFNNSAIVYRPYHTYFDVLVGTGNGKTTFCDASAGHGGECVLFNGVVKGLQAGALGDPLFAYQPNPFRSPGESHKDVGPKLGVRVSFSLLHSADGTNPETSSYVAQMVNHVKIGSVDAVGTDFRTQKGWVATASLWTRLSAGLSITPSTGQVTYTNFCKAYYMYAVCARFLLAIYQLAPCCSLDLETQMPIKLFCSAGEWTDLVVATLPQLVTSAAASGVATMLKNAQASAVFTAAKPVMKLMDAAAKTIFVSLTIPAILMAWVPDHLGDLLLRVFPRTDPKNFALGTVFDPLVVYGLLNDPGAALGAAPASAPPVFTVNSASVTRAYYTVSLTDPCPAAVIKAPTADDPVDCMAACVVTFDVQVVARGMTLLFYLYYLNQVGGVQIATVSDLLAAGEPAVRYMPAEVTYDAACAVLATGACSSTTNPVYEGIGSKNVNSMYLSPASQVCQCLTPTNVTPAQQTALMVQQAGASGAGVMSNEAMCFNVNCESTGLVFMDTAAILTANASNGGQCPVAPTTATTATAATTAPAVSLSPATYDCSQHCTSYIAGLRTGTVDMTNVNLNAVVEYCGIDIVTAVTATPPNAQVVLAGALSVCATPLLYLVVLAASLADLAKQRKESGNQELPFSRTTAGMPEFYAPCALVFVLACAAFAYCMLDMRGTHQCRWRSTPDAAGYTYHSSQCRSNGLWGFPQYNLPEDLCTTAPMYCQCDPKSLNLPCTASSCGCITSDCCSMEGICTQPTFKSTPLTGRPLQLKSTVQRFSFATTALCAAAALVLVPVVVAGAVCGARSSSVFSQAPLLLAALAVVLTLIVLAACAFPVVHRAITPSLYTTLEVGVGSCTSLGDYPDTLVLSTDTSVVYSATIALGLSPYPVYLREYPPECTVCCSSATAESYCATACDTALGCICAWSSTPGPGTCFPAPPPQVAYNADKKEWQMSNPDLANSPVLHNVQGSGVLYQQGSLPGSSDTATNPTLYAMFQDDARTAANIFVFCGKLATASTCAASGDSA